MSIARSEFLNRLTVLTRTLAESFVQDGALQDVEKNEVARLVRNGLAVAGFSHLEAFLRGRSSEVLASLSNSGIAFAQLPAKVQHASTVGLIKTLQARVKIYQDDASKVAFVQQQSNYIASTAATPFVLSELAFGYEGSNLSKDVVKDLLSAFRIKDGWGQISALAAKVGLGTLSLATAFENAARRRHVSAHVAMAPTPYGDLISFLGEARAIAFGFDVMLSTALIKIRQRDRNYLPNGILSESDVKLMLVEKTRRSFRLRDYGSNRARKSAESIAIIEPFAVARANAIGGAFAVLDASGQLTRWGIPGG